MSGEKHRRLMKRKPMPLKGDPQQVPYEAWCQVHEKKGFTRSNAKKAKRQLHDPQQRPYPCDHIQGLWHVGRIPLVVKRGLTTASEEYARRKALAMTQPEEEAA